MTIGAICDYRCPKLRRVHDSNDPTATIQWFIDPSYYMFAHCKCDEVRDPVVRRTQPRKGLHLQSSYGRGIGCVCPCHCV